jgi:hypothetical protein
VNDELERMWKEVVMAYFKVPSQHLCGLTLNTQLLRVGIVPRVSKMCKRVWFSVWQMITSSFKLDNRGGVESLKTGINITVRFHCIGLLREYSLCQNTPVPSNFRFCQNLCHWVFNINLSSHTYHNSKLSLNILRPTPCYLTKDSSRLCVFVFVTIHIQLAV